MEIAILVLVGLILITLIIFLILRGYVLKKRRVCEERYVVLDRFFKKRHSLLVRLAELTQTYMAHEIALAEELIEARNKSLSAVLFTDKTVAENKITGVVVLLMEAAEKYPNLKLNGDFFALKNELHSSLLDIRNVGNEYNRTVRAYNEKIGSGGWKTVADLFRIRPFLLFDMELPEKM